MSYLATYTQKQPSMRYFILLVITALSACNEQPHGHIMPTPASTADGIATGRLAEAGFDTVMIHQLEHAIAAQVYPNIHSLLIARNNKLVYENYWPGQDEVWGTAKGNVPHHMDSL